MAAYYKVDVVLNSQAVSVGLPSPQSVRVTLPLVGPAGEKGDKGDKGDPGDQGPQGVPGTGLEVLTTQGDLLYQGAETGERLPIGAEGKVLKVESGVPAWGEAEAGVTSWNDLEDKPSTFPPEAHASTHATAGSDPLFDQDLNTTDTVTFADLTSTGPFAVDQITVGGGKFVIDSEATKIECSIPIEFGDTESAATTRDNLGLGTAAISDAGDFAAAVHGHVAADISDFATAAAAAAPVQSVAGRTGTVTLAKADVGLSNVDNTADLSKPISTATQSALDGKAASSHTHTASQVTDFATAAAAAAPVSSVNGNTGTVTVAVPSASTATPQALGTAAAGTSDDYSRGDHIHAAPALNDLSNVSAATPSDNDVLVFDTATSTWVAEAPAGGGSSGTKTYAVFTPDNNQPTATAFATLDTRNSIAVLDFDDAATESAVFVGILPEAADVTSGLIVSLRWMATTATSGDVRWSVAWEKSNTDLDSDSFDTATAATATANGTSGIVTVTNITCTTIDSLAAGDLFRLRVQRVGGDGADTMTGDAELVAVEVRSAA
jgi:hypothetical protein